MLKNFIETGKGFYFDEEGGGLSSNRDGGIVTVAEKRANERKQGVPPEARSGTMRVPTAGSMEQVAVDAAQQSLDFAVLNRALGMARENYPGDWNDLTLEQRCGLAVAVVEAANKIQLSSETTDAGVALIQSSQMVMQQIIEFTQMSVLGRALHPEMRTVAADIYRQLGVLAVANASRGYSPDDLLRVGGIGDILAAIETRRQLIPSKVQDEAETQRITRTNTELAARDARRAAAANEVTDWLGNFVERVADSVKSVGTRITELALGEEEGVVDQGSNQVIRLFKNIVRSPEVVIGGTMGAGTYVAAEIVATQYLTTVSPLVAPVAGVAATLITALIVSKVKERLDRGGRSR